MSTLYFTALNPASDLDIKLKKISIELKLYSPLPPIIPIGKFSAIISQKEFNYNIDIIDEFKTTGISTMGPWLIEEIEDGSLDNLVDSPFDILGLKKPALIIGQVESPPNMLPITQISTIRNWTLSFYELISHNTNNYNNIELIEHWRIKKKRNN